MKQTLIFSFIVGLAACSPGMTPVDAGMDMPDTNCDSNPEAVTLASLHTDLLGPKCASCHPSSAGMAYGDYTSATTAAAMINKTSAFAGSQQTLKVVDAAATDTSQRLANSSIWLKVSSMKNNGFRGPKNEITGLKMPNDGTPVTAAELKKLKDWLCRGAPQ
jgi:hypothetical protein